MLVKKLQNVMTRVTQGANYVALSIPLIPIDESELATNCPNFVRNRG